MRETFDVQFTFYPADEKGQSYAVGRVLNDGNEMLLDIPAQHGWVPHSIRGKKVEYYFAGSDEEDIDASARWALLGDVYVGVWLEEGDEYLFSFRLPRIQ